jgi:hypothetical protein
LRTTRPDTENHISHVPDHVVRKEFDAEHIAALKEQGHIKHGDVTNGDNEWNDEGHFVTAKGKKALAEAAETDAKKRPASTRTEPSGNFVHKETKRNFHWWDTKDEWAKKHGFPHEISVGHEKHETRFAHVKGTVAHVVVDEGADGKPVTEKWPIRDNWRKPGH